MGTFGYVGLCFYMSLRASVAKEVTTGFFFLFFCFCSYVAPEYASTGMLNERSDAYSFGILIMEIISGRNPVDYSRPPEEVCTILLISLCFKDSRIS